MPQCAAIEELSIGKYLAKRKLEPTPFFLEDPAKTKHRLKMSKKLGGGKKKGGAKLKALSAEQEAKLAELIAERADTTLGDEKENAPFKTPVTAGKRRSMASAQRKRRSSSRCACSLASFCSWVPICEGVPIPGEFNFGHKVGARKGWTADFDPGQVVISQKN